MEEVRKMGMDGRGALPVPSGVVLAAVDALLPRFPPLPSGDRECITHDVARFVAAEFKSLSPPLRYVIRCAFALLEAESLLCEGHRFRSLSRGGRAERLDRWTGSIFPLRNGLMRLLRSLVLLRFYDDRRVAGALDSGEKSR